MDYLYFLQNLGMNIKHNGTEYIAEFLFMYYDGINIEPFQSMGYELICRKFNVNKGAVIKEMQYAIDSLFTTTTKYETLYKIFGETISDETGRPGNKQFVYTLIDYFNNRI